MMGIFSVCQLAVVFCIGVKTNFSDEFLMSIVASICAAAIVSLFMITHDNIHRNERRRVVLRDYYGSFVSIHKFFEGKYSCFELLSVVKSCECVWRKTYEQRIEYLSENEIFLLQGIFKHLGTINSREKIGWDSEVDRHSIYASLTSLVEGLLRIVKADPAVNDKINNS